MTLEISRANVVSTHIVEGLPDRFLKLPITTYLDELGVVPIRSQIALVNAVNMYRFVVAALSRRQGKTYIANIIGQVVALVPGCNILIMSPNYSLSQISFDLQRGLIKHFGLEVTKDNAKDKVIELSNGSTIRMGSVNQVDSVVGRSYDLIIFDEAALADGEDAFNVALRPTLDKDNARAIFISTPRGKANWFSKFYQRGFSSEYPQWCSIKATYHENPRVSEEDIADAKRSMSDAFFKQEYLADFNQYEGQIWNLSEDFYFTVNDEIEIDPEIQLDPHVQRICASIGVERHKMDIIGGLDLGYKDPTALCVVGYAWEQEKYYILDEYFMAEKTTSSHAANIQEIINKWDIDYIYVDHAAAQTRFDLARDYDISTIAANKSLIDGINYVASLIDNDKLWVNKDCVECIRTFDAYQWDPNPNLVKEKPKHDMASHMADALRYALYTYESTYG